jgi:hypothetical protein
VVLRYTKEREAAYLQHLTVIDALSRALLICGIDAAYSEGFNPMPRIETTQPISIAIDSKAEIASILLYAQIEPSEFARRMNEKLPMGIRIEKAEYYPVIEGRKLKTIGSLEWGSAYSLAARDGELSDALGRDLREALSRRAIAGCELADSEDGRIRLRLPLPEKKENGLLRILEECTPERPVQRAIDIVRVETLAKTDDPSGPSSFFEAYSRA